MDDRKSYIDTHNMAIHNPHSHPVTHRFTLLFCLVFLCSMLNAQTDELTFPYFNSFEDATENAAWHLLVGNEAEDCIDKWYIGANDDVAPIDGEQALYISSDGGVSPVFGNDKNVVVVYRKVALPSTITKNKRVELTFDWKNQAPDKSGAALYVALIPDNFPLVVESDNGSFTEPVWLGGYKQNITIPTSTRPVEKLQDAGFWTTAHTKLDMIPGEVYKLVFVWINDGKSNTTEKNADPYISACIDNIQMSSADCPMPINVVIEDGCDSTVVKWNGNIYNYELQWRQSGTVTWKSITDIHENRHTFTNMPEGIYDFRVRSIGTGDEVSVYNASYSQLVFCPDNHCINYVDLKSPDIKCYKGMATWGNASLSECDPVDYGYKERMSRHTVHWDPNEYDPRTLGKLKTVPAGELASIRLGNWLNGSEAEAIDIKYEVDVKKAAVLLLSYALVFEEPNHDKEEQPYFKLVLLTDDGYELDPTCGKAEFYADPNDPAWTRNAHNGSSIAWKNWTTIGFDLSLYDGETITIHLESRDCAQGAHYAYSYFVMGCASGTIENVSCGADPIVNLEAPIGFDYRWYTSAEPDKTITDEQVLSVEASDRTSYMCDVMFKQNHDCKFTLTTVVSPREPHAEYEYKFVPKGCRNIVQLINKSHVDSRDENGNIICTDEPTETAYWWLDGGDVMYGDTVTYELPREGGKLNVKLKVGLSDDHCVDSLIESITVPTILSRPDTIDSVICWGDYIQFEGAILATDTIHTAYLKNCAECDSLMTVILDVKDRIYPTEITDTICFGDSLVYDGKVYKTEGQYSLNYPTPEGCDSIVNVSLAIRPEVTFTYSTKPEAGAPNTGEIVISDAPEGYTYELDGVPDAPLTGLKGGTYVLQLFSRYGCPSTPVAVTVDKECLEVDTDFSGIHSACSGDSVIVLPCGFPAGVPTTYAIEYGQSALDAGFVNSTDTFDVDEVTVVIPDSCRAGHYDAELTIYDVICEEQVFPLAIDVLYPSDIIVQKWDNVLAVKNERYNGGYTFAAFQWYKDDVPLTGEIGSYLYLGADAVLDTAGAYSVMLTKADDGVSLRSCPVIPTVAKPEVSPYPVVTALPAGMPLKIKGVERRYAMRVYNAAGQLCFAGSVDEGEDEIDMPTVPGVYLLVMDDGESAVHHKMLVR